MHIDLVRKFDANGLSLWGFDQPTEYWVIPDLLRFASNDAFDDHMLLTFLADDYDRGDTLQHWLRKWTSPAHFTCEIEAAIPLTKRFYEFGALAYYDLDGKLDLPGLHYLGRERSKSLSELDGCVAAGSPTGTAQTAAYSPGDETTFLASARRDIARRI